MNKEIDTGEQGSIKEIPEEESYKLEQEAYKSEQRPSKRKKKTNKVDNTSKIVQKRKKVLLLVPLIVVCLGALVFGITKIASNSNDIPSENSVNDTDENAGVSFDDSDKDLENHHDSEETTKEKIDEIKGIAKATLSIDKTETVSTEAPEYTKITYEGNISYDNQVDEYSYVVKNDGTLRVEVHELMNNVCVYITIIDSAGEVVAFESDICNEDGVTVRGLKADEEYTIQIEENEGFSQYTLIIYEQKATIDLSEFTEIKDSIDYIDQRIIYTFTPSRSGCYRLDFSEMKSGVSVSVSVENYLEEIVEYDNGICNNDGVTLSDLESGQTYTIEVNQDVGIGSYILNIGSQKKTVDITKYSHISDSIQYEDQRNIYTFEAPSDGVYRIDISNLKSGIELQILVFNHLDEIVESEYSVYNDDGITLDGLTAGETYEIQVRQSSGIGDYTLFLGKQKPTNSIEKGSNLKDSIEYTDQCNMYTFYSEENGVCKISLSGLVSGCCVRVIVLNELEESLVSDSFYNEESVEFEVQSGETYEIQISQDSGLSKYNFYLE